MSTIKNGQISLCHFNKIIKGLETSFQSPGFPLMVGVGGTLPPSHDSPPSIKIHALPMPPLPPPKNEAPPQLKNKPPHWKMKSPSRKRFLEKNIQKIGDCHLAKIPQKHDFLSWSIQNFIKKWNSLLEIFILLD